MRIANLFSSLPVSPDAEVFEPLLSAPAFLLERIVSTGQATPPGEWLEQERDEWVMLASGSARLSFEGEESEVTLQPGDYVVIPAGCRHRVAWTDPARPTVWLALHVDPAASETP